MSRTRRADGIVRLEDYAPPAYLIPEIHLSFNLDDTETRVVAELTVERAAGTDPGALLELDGEDLALLDLSIDGRPVAEADRSLTPEGLTIVRPPKSKRFKVSTTTSINPSLNCRLMGLYLSNGVFCTHCEAEGFRRITYFPDRPDVLSVYTVRIEANEKRAPTLLSNGNRLDAGRLPDGRHYSVWRDPFPKPCYLFALVAGDLGSVTDRFVTQSGRDIRLGIHVERGKEHRAHYAMDVLKRSMRWDETAFGREYDLEEFNIVAVSDFNMGAMENKGLNIFNDKYVLVDEETATDADFANVETMVAHEYFHNWTGNRITCRDWFQLCLKEGLTVFRDHEFSADQRSRSVRRVQEVRLLKAHQFPEDQGPLAHPVRPRRYREINNFYTATVYEKGSEVVRMLRIVLGDSAFRRGLDLYFERHDGQAVTIEDFLRCFSDVSGRDLDQFALWYNQAGTPHLTVNSRYEASSRTITVDIEQTLSPTPDGGRKRLMHIPVAFGLVGPDGRDLKYDSVEGAEVASGVIHLRKRRHKLRFSGVARRPVLSLNRGFSAPVNIAQEARPAELLLLARHDSDLFGRWQALTRLLTDLLVDTTNALRWGKRTPSTADAAGLLRDTALDVSLEPAYRALALTLPTETDIAREIGSNLDPEAIFAARERLHRDIARANRDAFQTLHGELSDDRPYSPDGASAGRRTLRNTLLDLLCQDGASPERATEQYRRATNMTDRIAALTILAHRFPEEAADALEIFETRYRDDPLVMDKWFTVQATMPGPGAVETVARLKRHPLYAPTNPNRVRSLVMAFANANPTGFHRPDGVGYALLAETILESDKANPHLASRLATVFRSWRCLEPARREKARHTIAALARTSGCSVDLSDIMERTLQ